MREAIKYFYNVNIKEVHEIDNGCYFFFHDFKYYFVRFERDVNEIGFLVKISNDLYEKNILVDTFILSKNNTYYVNVDEDVYVLLRVNSVENDLCNLKDIVYFNNLLISKNVQGIRGDWATLWMKKVDDLEMQASEINTEYPLIQESFDYYVGMAENAILYFKEIVSKEDMNLTKINLNHKRTHSKVYSGQLNNPLTFTFDYEVRDVAEYMKSKFFSGNIDYDEIEDLILDSNYSKVSLMLLFDRLLYPSYYFDALKNIYVYDFSEDILKKYISKVNNYEDFLVYVYKLINKKVYIPPIDWLVNRD